MEPIIFVTRASSLISKMKRAVNHKDNDAPATNDCHPDRCPISLGPTFTSTTSLLSHCKIPTNEGFTAGDPVEGCGGEDMEYFEGGFKTM